MGKFRGKFITRQTPENGVLMLPIFNYFLLFYFLPRPFHTSLCSFFAMNLSNKFSFEIHFTPSQFWPAIKHYRFSFIYLQLFFTCRPFNVVQSEREKVKNTSRGAKAITLFFMDILPPHNFYKPPAPSTLHTGNSRNI